MHQNFPGLGIGVCTQIFCNGRLIATGPSVVGGDFLGNGKPREWYYANELSFSEDQDFLDFFVRVKMCPTQICEYSKGHGGLMLSATVTFVDGSCEFVTTDDSWLVRKNRAYQDVYCYDGRVVPDQYVNAEIIPDIWQVKLAPIPVREEKKIIAGEIQLNANEEITKEFDFDKIYAGFVYVASIGGTVDTAVTLYETDVPNLRVEKAILSGRDEYRGFQLRSVGKIKVGLKNESDEPAVVKIGLITTHYPITVEAQTTTSDKELNELLSICKHTLKYCRQTHHLDSPRHCEPLACTGDYYIESLMTSFSFGDMRLAEFDLERTAELLRHNDGRMFHTTYSLIWVRMLYDVYMFGGNFEMLTECRDALDLLLARFETYIGENHLIENPPAPLQDPRSQR